MIERLATRYGRMFVPDTDIAQYWWFANTGASPEDEFIAAVLAMLDERPRGIAVDAGANFGAWTLALASRGHPVVAFEPQRACANLLKQSVDANGYDGVAIYTAAAGDRPGSIAVPDLDLDQPSNFGGVALSVPHHEQPAAPMLTVPVYRIDDVLPVERVSFIKADVEGFEAGVLAGARAAIARCKPILFVEMDHPLTDPAALKGLIEGMGYATEKRGGNYLGMPV